VLLVNHENFSNEYFIWNK